MEHADAHGAEDHVAAFERARMGMWLFLGSEIMMFGAFISTYVILRMSPTTTPDVVGYLQDHLSWKVGGFNTLVLIASSFTVVRAVHAIRNGNRSQCEDMLILTAALGLVFLVVKAFEYGGKFGEGIGPDTNVMYGCYFLMTGFHGLHVLIGVIVLVVVAFFGSKFDAQHYAHVECTALYWHLVDVIWIFLFPIVYLL